MAERLSSLTGSFVLSDDHFTDRADSLGFEEHMFCTNQTDTFSTEFKTALDICLDIRVHHDFHTSACIDPAHELREVAFDRSRDRLDSCAVNFTGRTV